MREMEKPTRPEHVNAANPDRPPRISMLLVAECVRGDGSVCKMKIRNLSSTGLRAGFINVSTFDSDEPVKIVFRNHPPIAAQIVWFNQEEIGVQFDHPIDPSKITQARSQASLPEASPRSEDLNNWVHRREREREYERLKRSQLSKRPI